jgi:hypothetical protein
VLTGAVAGLLIKEFCRREEPIIFDVRVGFVRVCLAEVRKFEVAKVVAVEVAMTLKVFGYRAVTGKRGNLSQSPKFSHRKQSCSKRSRSSIRETGDSGRHELISCTNGGVNMRGCEVSPQSWICANPRSV